MRAVFTGRVYGFREGLRAVPRAIVANLINALAASRAVSRYRQALISGEALRWDKTEHRTPDSSWRFSANG